MSVKILYSLSFRVIITYNTMSSCSCVIGCKNALTEDISKKDETVQQVEVGEKILSGRDVVSAELIALLPLARESCLVSQAERLWKSERISHSASSGKLSFYNMLAPSAPAYDGTGTHLAEQIEHSH